LKTNVNLDMCKYIGSDIIRYAMFEIKVKKEPYELKLWEL